METCTAIPAYELGDYAAHDLDGYRPLSDPKGLSQKRKQEISEHCKICPHCQTAAETLRQTFQNMPKMGKSRRECSLLNIGDRLKQAAMQPN